MGWTLLALWVLGCSQETTEQPPGPVGDQHGEGAFQLEIVPPGDQKPGMAAILGKVNDGPNPELIVWESASIENACELLVPRIPFCYPSCPNLSACVEDDVCQEYPSALDVGTVTVDGVETTDGETRFTMDPIAGYYQPAATIDLAIPPFAEGGVVTFTASGTPTAAPFTLTATGVSALEVLSESITLEDGEPVVVQWVPPAEPSLSTVLVSVNISYHGGTKGRIICRTPDTGVLELSGPILDELKALGVSGWPMMVFTRTSRSHTEPEMPVELIIESSVTQFVNIPGLTSCDSDADCPDGLTCQADFQCG